MCTHSSNFPKHIPKKVSQERSLLERKKFYDKEFHNQICLGNSTLVSLSNPLEIHRAPYNIKGSEKSCSKEICLTLLNSAFLRYGYRLAINFYCPKPELNTHLIPLCMSQRVDRKGFYSFNEHAQSFCGEVHTV